MKRSKKPQQQAVGLFSVRRTTLREPRRCSLCGTGLAKGTEALVDVTGQTFSCVECPSPASGPSSAN